MHRLTILSGGPQAKNEVFPKRGASTSNHMNIAVGLFAQGRSSRSPKRAWLQALGGKCGIRAKDESFSCTVLARSLGSLAI